jgi:integrase
MTENRRIEQGISLTPAGRYRVRVQDRSSSSAMVTRTVDTLPDARSLVVAAERIRSSGGSVKQSWTAERLSSDRARVQTFAEFAEAWLAGRRQLMETSDHSRAANHRGVSSLRPGTYWVEDSLVRCHLISRLGALLTTDVERADVRAVMAAMAAAGLADATQERVLMKLRQMCGELRTSQRPDAFPWANVTPIRPAKPRTRPQDPSKWSGSVGSKPPVATYSDVKEIASEIRACWRCVIWLQAVMGLRRGEAMAVRNRDFQMAEGGPLVLRVFRQLDLNTGQLRKYTKSDASTRPLIVPEVFAEYLCSYWDRYHDGYRPGSEATMHLRHHKRLVVTSTGRDSDGSFLEGSPIPFPRLLGKALKATARTHNDLGHTIKPHFFRKTPSTYLMHAEQILRSIMDSEATAARPDDAASAEELAAWAIARYERKLKLERVRFTGAAISQFMGHTERRRGSGEDDGTSASPITLAHYGLAFANSDTGAAAIADFLDLTVRHEIGDLLDDPDPTDTYLVIRPGDPDWVLVPEASIITSKSVHTLSAGIRTGAYRGQLCWFADGNREAPGPRLVIHSDDIQRILKRNASISRSEAARRLKMSNNYIDGAIRRHDLVVIEHHQTTVYIDPNSVEQLRIRMLEAVASVFPTTGSIPLATAHQQFQAACRDEVTPSQIALDALAAGATLREAAELSGINANTVGSLRRRNRRAAENMLGAEDRASVRRLFARPKRVPVAKFSGWVDDAIDAGLLTRVNQTHLRRTSPSNTAGDLREPSSDSPE